MVRARAKSDARAEWHAVLIATRLGDSAIEQSTTSDIVQPTLPKRFRRFSMASDRPGGSSLQMWGREPESRRVCSANGGFASSPSNRGKPCGAQPHPTRTSRGWRDAPKPLGCVRRPSTSSSVPNRFTGFERPTRCLNLVAFSKSDGVLPSAGTAAARATRSRPATDRRLSMSAVRLPPRVELSIPMSLVRADCFHRPNEEAFPTSSASISPDSLVEQEAHRMCPRAAPRANDWSVSFARCMSAMPMEAAS